MPVHRGGGLASNLETFAFFSGPRHASVLSGVRGLLERLEARGILSDGLDLGEVIAALPRATSTPLLHNVDEPLLEQVARRVKGPLDRLEIVSPVNADPASIVRRLHSRFGPKEVVLRTDLLRKAMRRVAGVDRYMTLRRPTVKDGTSDEGEEAAASPVQIAHAKVYAMHRGGSVDVFWGSANLSAAAWSTRNANLELLVHSTVTERQWERFLESVPDGHWWVSVKPTLMKFEPPELSSGWEPLQVVVDGRRVWVEATIASQTNLVFRRGHKGTGVKVRLAFKEGMSAIPAGIAVRLGLFSTDPPSSLCWRIAGGKWGRVAVVQLGRIGDTSADPIAVVDALTVAYGGRVPPSPTKGSEPPVTDSSPRDDEEQEEVPEVEELDRCEHLGDLDRFVLQWRAVAGRIAQSSGANDELRRARLDRALALARAEARLRPERWTTSKLEYVARLLGGKGG